jgi:hypothetical protein
MLAFGFSCGCGAIARRSIGLRRVLGNFKKQKLVWVTDVQALLNAAGEQR